MNGLINRQRGKLNAKSIRILIQALLVLCFSFIQMSGYCQAKENEYEFNKSQKKKKKGFQMDRVIVGGGFGLQFGDITLVDISPTVGYMLTDRLLSGIGGRYMYFESKIPGLEFKDNIYGGNVFSQYLILENFLAHVELEVLNLQRGYDLEDRINITSFFVGGGYRSSLGGNSFASILILYNLNDDIYTPYTNPVIRIGFGIGL